jgi:hypothetical protein
MLKERLGELPLRFVGSYPLSRLLFVYILYIDESGDGGTNPGSSRHLVLAGVAIHEGQWRTLSRKLDSIQDSHFPQAGSPIEFHASEIRSGRNFFRSVGRAERTSLMNDVYGVSPKSPVNESCCLPL